MQLVKYHIWISLFYFIFLIATVSHFGVGLQWHVLYKSFTIKKTLKKWFRTIQISKFLQSSWPQCAMHNSGFKGCYVTSYNEALTMVCHKFWSSSSRINLKMSATIWPKILEQLQCMTGVNPKSWRYTFQKCVIITESQYTFDIVLLATGKIKQFP